MAKLQQVKSEVAAKIFCPCCPDWEIKHPERCSNTLEAADRTLYFCTKRCKERFLKNPEKFLGNPAELLQRPATSKKVVKPPQETDIPGDSPIEQLAGFIDKFSPENAKLIQSCRKTMRKRFPTALELVYDNYNFLAIGYCSTERASDCIVSLACSAKGVSLSFYYGATLPDPDGILLGSGNQNRFVRLESAKTLEEPAVAAMIDAAVAQAKTPLPTLERGRTIIKSISEKQRPRR